MNRPGICQALPRRAPLLLLAVLLAAGCQDTPSGVSPGDPSADGARRDVGTTGDGPARDAPPGQEAGGAPDGSPSEGGAGPDSAASMPNGREVVYSAIERSCVGCNKVSYCGIPPLSDITGQTLVPALNNQTGDLFAAERWERPGRSLPLDTCQHYADKLLAPLITAPVGVTVLDGGTITLFGAMPLLTPGLSASYAAVTKNYAAVMKLANTSSANAYKQGVKLTLQAPGGAGAGPFKLTWTSPEPIEIISPHTDASGKIQNIAKNQALPVTWTGGAGYSDVVIILDSFYCGNDTRSMVLCRAKNDGAFTIPAPVMSKINWTNVVELLVTQSHKAPLPAAGLTRNAAWSVRSFAWLPVYHDPQAAPPVYKCTATTMSTGKAGKACKVNADCGSGCCLPVWKKVYFHGGYCSLLNCETDADCPKDAVCAQNKNGNIPYSSYCARRCITHADCRTPWYACLNLPGGKTGCIPNFF
jgi:hypothetical protein